MSAFSWIILSIAIVQVCAQGDTEIYTSENYPSFYEGEDGVFKCQFTLQRDEFEDMTGFGVRKVAPEASNDVFGCAITKTPGGVNTFTSGNVGRPTAEECTAAYDDFSASLTSQLIISMKITETGQYKCTWFDTTAYGDQEPAVDVQVLLVAPTSLSIEITPAPQMYSGNTVQVVCESEGGTPGADFVYGKGDDELTAASIYEVSRADNGAKFWCRDRSHPHLKGGNSVLTYLEQKIVVYYFTGSKPEISYMTVNPSSTHKLDCTTEENLPAGVNITYIWENNGMVMDGETKRLLEVSQMNVNETMSEIYQCKATTTDNQLTEVKVKYNVTWNVEAPTPTKPTTTKKPAAITKGAKIDKGDADEVKKGGSETTIIIVVVVVVTVVILIIVIVIIVVKKRSKSADVSKPGGQAPPTNKGDEEQGNGDAEVTVPMLDAESRGKDRPIEEPGKQ